MADVGLDAGGSSRASGSSNRAGKADKGAFDRASDKARMAASQNTPETGNNTADGQDTSKSNYRDQMEGLRRERKELEAERDWFKSGIANKASIPEIQQEISRVGPELARVDQEIARNGSEQVALAKRMETNDVTEEGETCKIEVRVKPALFPGVPGNHSYITLSDSDGEHYVRGGPESRVQAPEDGSVFGRELTDKGRYLQNTPDWSTEPRSSVTVAELEGDCSPHFRKMERTAEAIDRGDHPYHAIFDPQNCNSVTNTVLQRSGFDTPNLPGWNPGLDKDLIDR